MHAKCPVVLIGIFCSNDRWAHTNSCSGSGSGGGGSSTSSKSIKKMCYATESSRANEGRVKKKTVRIKYDASTSCTLWVCCRHLMLNTRDILLLFIIFESSEERQNEHESKKTHRKKGTEKEEQQNVRTREKRERDFCFRLSHLFLVFWWTEAKWPSFIKGREIESADTAIVVSYARHNTHEPNENRI